AKGNLDTIPFPSQAVLVLSEEYIDDLPGFVNPQHFCAQMSEHMGATQQCIPLEHNKANLDSDIFNTIKYTNYHKVSPFELKNTLIKKAQASEKLFLNVGRGNPNFVNTTAREAFAHLLLFASSEASRLSKADKQGDTTDNPAIGFAPNEKGISDRLDDYMRKLKDRGGRFLKEAVVWMKSNYIIHDPDDLVHQLVIAALGSFYPDPPQVQPFVNAVMNEYMDYILLHSNRPRGKFNVFMTEGATAGIMYTFKSLRINGLLASGDTIAIITPYLELPELKKYDLKELYIPGDPEQGWKIPLENLDVLKNKKIKAVFLVNPTNPSAVSMTEAHVAKVGEIIRNHNPDLLIIADSVYAPFVKSYHSFMSVAPKNTIEMYSFSKYFGVTGWRMGMIVIHPDNIIDNKLLPNLPNKTKQNLNQRYSIVTETSQEELTFMQRLVLDSRDVAEAHTGGLATPQQTLMSLFAIYDMTHREYKPSIKNIIVKRIELLYTALGETPPLGTGETDYYTIIDIKKLATQRHGAAFVQKLIKRDCLEFVFRLAIDYATIALPIAGFHGPCWAIRISLANAPTNTYTEVGKNIVAVIDDMFKAYD
ncbi:hypothetical protein LCGC14_1972660, partial [marine sediment metagenome]